MICNETIKNFCPNPQQIENYQEALNDPDRVWDCHHRRETDEGLTKKQLIKMGLYYHRPPEELIFLTRKDHRILHGMPEEQKLKRSQQWSGDKNPMYNSRRYGIKNPFYGKQHTIETKIKMSANHRDVKRDKNPNYKFICPLKLLYLYNKQKMTINSIAEELNVSRYTVWRRLQELK